MTSTTMDRFADTQAQIACRRQAASQGYPELWRRITSEWNSPGLEDRAWLLYSANYLFRTGGVRWALDPITLRRRVPSAPAVDAAALSSLAFIVLTHRHTDHLDINLLRSLRDNPIRFIVPEFLLEQVVRDAGIPESSILVPAPLQELELNGIRITPFEASHLEPDPSLPGGQRGVPETGYLVEFSGKRWLFPGDTRCYDAARVPRFGRVDGVLAHLWLGRLSALHENLPLIEPFARYYLDLHPGKVIITHLEDISRDANSYWDEVHAARVIQHIHELAPSLEVTTARMGDSFDL